MLRKRRELFAPALLLALCLAADARADFRLLVVEASNNVVSELDAGGSATTFASGLRTPIGLAVAGTGEVFVTNFTAGYVEKFSATGQDLGVFASGLSLPSDVAVDQAGNVYVIEYFGGRIEKFSATGQDLGTFATFFGSPNRMAFDSAGNLYVTVNSEIEKFSPSGQHLASIFSVSPIGLTISSSDVIYVADVGSQAIRMYSTSGAFLGVFATTSQGFIESLVFDATGNLYASNELRGTIEKYSPTGQDLGVFASGLGSPEVMAFAAPTAVPEPSSLALCGVACLAVLGVARGARCNPGFRLTGKQKATYFRGF